MAKKKINYTPTVFGGPGAASKTRGRGRRFFAEIGHETGDPEKDGKIWLSRIAMTRRQRLERRNGENDWRRYYLWYQGEQWQDRGMISGTLASDNARQTATVNKTGSLINSMVPFLINSRIKFLLKPRKPTEDVSAELQEGILNYEWRERAMTKQVTRCARDFATIGHCVAKIGYTVEVDTAYKPAVDGEIDYRAYVRKDAPWLERVDPLCFFFDLSARDYTLNSARWCAEIFFVPMNDVLANKSYNQEVLDKISSGDATTATRSAFEGVGLKDTWGRSTRVSVPEDNLIVLIEIWDKKYRNRIIMADGVPWPLSHEKWPYDYLDNFPYEMANYIDVANDCYGIGIPRWIEDQQIQLNRIRTAEFNHVRAHQRKFLADANQIQDPELKKFEDGGDGTIVKAQSTEAIKPIPDAAMSPDFQIVEGRIVADINEMTGADALLQGQALPSRTTSGEVATRGRIFSLKLDGPVGNLEDFVEASAIQVLHHLKKNRIVADVVKIVGAQGEFWREYTSEEIQADVDVEVESFSAPKVDPSIEMSQAIQVLQLGVQALPALQQTGNTDELNVAELFRWVLEKFGEKDIGRFFKRALQPRPPLVEGEEEGAGAGLPPALAGQLAPGQVPGGPPAAVNPGEGLSPADLMQGIQGAALTSGMPQ